ncbi:MAG: radical SAM/SPASM domain-containing protein [Candidatus Margulisiibacteriota bacterium]
MNTPARYSQQIELEPTNACNAKCVFCPRNDPRAKGLISEATVQAAIDLAKATGINVFKISGFGEPLLHPKLPALLRLIKQQVPNAAILLITNASLLKPPLFAELAGLVNRYNISFNGYDQKSYEQLMVGLDFQQTLDNLRYAAANNRGRANIQFTPVINKAFGLADLEKMKELLTGLGFNADNFKFHHIITTRSQKLADNALVDEAFLAASKKNASAPGTKALCLTHLSTLFISWEGNIHICCNDIHGEAVIGRIAEVKTLDDLIALEKKNLNARFSEAFDVCRRCDVPAVRPHQVINGKTYTEMS